MPDQPPLKLLVVTMMYDPDCVGIAAIASDMCASFAERGHRVTVLTTYPYYPEWRLKAKAGWRVQEESIRGVRVLRHRIFVPSAPSRLLPRLLHELSFPVSLMRSLFHRQRYDVVMAFCPLVGAVVFAATRKMLFREPLWVNVQDIPVEAASASGMIRSGTFARLASKLQTFLLNRGDIWSSISPQMIQQLETIKDPAVPLHCCPNWITDDLQRQILQLPSKVGRHPDGTTRLLYCGTIGKKQGLKKLCQTLSQCDGDFHFQIHGDGSEADEVRRWVESSRDGRFDWGLLLPQAEFVKAIHDADWFVIPQTSSAGNSFFPSKLIPSLSIGTPILAISDHGGPLAHEVSENAIGLIVPWDQAEGLTAQLNHLMSCPQEFERMQANCLKRAEAYKRESRIDQLITLLRQTASVSHEVVHA